MSKQRQHEPVLDRGCVAAAATIASRWLEDAEKCLRRMRKRSDAEALHDFRVAIRRLRSTLQAYRPWLGRAAGGKLRRRLRELARATSPGRDAQVQVAWIQAQARTLAQAERGGARRLLEDLRPKARRGLRGIEREFRGIATDLRERLKRAAQPTPAFRTVFAELLEAQIGELGESLGKLKNARKALPAHEARIRTKRLRYLLEPAARELNDGRKLVEGLRMLQDLLGELHDAHVVEETLRRAGPRTKARALRPGLNALVVRNRERRDRLFAALDAKWISGRAANLLASLSRAAQELRHTSEPPREIERKFLLSALPLAAAAVTPEEIEQGWLPGEHVQERIRRIKTSAGERYLRTIKLGQGLSGIEVEEEASAEAYAALWPLTEGRRVCKRRYRVSGESGTWEVDQFADPDLVLAEIELADPGSTPEFPDWLTTYVTREVTGDPAYLNRNLAH